MKRLNDALILKDFKWYVTNNTSLGNVIFPATAGAEPSDRMYRTVVVVPLSKNQVKQRVQ